MLLWGLLCQSLMWLACRHNRQNKWVNAGTGSVRRLVLLKTSDNASLGYRREGKQNNWRAAANLGAPRQACTHLAASDSEGNLKQSAFPSNACKQSEGIRLILDKGEKKNLFILLPPCFISCLMMFSRHCCWHRSELQLWIRGGLIFVGLLFK